MLIVFFRWAYLLPTTATTNVSLNPRTRTQAAGLLHERARAGGRDEDVQEQGELPHDGRLCQALRRRRDEVPDDSSVVAEADEQLP